jgi:integrase
MSLVQRKGIWQWRKMIDGVMLNRSTKTDDKALATKIARKWDHEAVQQIKVLGERPVTLYDAIDGFLAVRKHTRGYGVAEQQMRHWKKLLPDGPMKSIQKHQVQAAVHEMITLGRATNTVALFITYWNALVNYCVQKRLSPGPKLDRIKPALTRFRVITLAEETAILAELSPDIKYIGKNANTDRCRQDNHDIIVCLSHLAARISEASNLLWSDIDFDRNTILVRRLKNGNNTLALMSKALRAVMERRYPARTNNFVFPTKCGDKNGLSSWLKDLVTRAGISEEGGKITSHTFRHTTATRLLRSGMDITMVQKFLGHKQISSTMVYLHSQPSEVASKALVVFDGN